MSFCVPAVHTRQRFSDPLLSAPYPGVERLLRQHVVRLRIMQQAVRRKASSNKPPSPLFHTKLEHPGSGMQNVVLWHVVLCACCAHTQTTSPTHCSTQVLLTEGSKAFCVSASCGYASCSRHKASSNKPPSPLFPTRLEHPGSGMQNVVLWHVDLCACAHTQTASPTHCSTQALLAEGSKAFCVSASCGLASCSRPSDTRLPQTSCGHASCSRPSDARLPHAYLYHPSSLPGSSIQSLSCKM